MLGGWLLGGCQFAATAGIFTWSAPVAITTADTTLNQSGTVVGAEVFGNDGKIVTLSSGAVLDFKADGSVATTTGFGTAYGAFTNNSGNANFNGVLTQFNYDGGPKTITLNNLVVGQQYSVQLFAVDHRDGIAATRVANFQDPNDASDISTTFQMGDNVYTMGTFVANNTSVAIQENLLNSSSGNINALVIRAIGTNMAPQITTQPAPATIYNGLTAQFAAAALGTGTLSYQWQKAPVGSNTFTNLPNGARVSGASSNVVTITGLVAGDTSDYRVVVANSFGSVTSTPAATLTVLAGTPQFNWSNPLPITTANNALIQSGTVIGAAVFGATETLVTLSNNATLDFKADGSVAAITAGGFGATASGAYSGSSGNANFDGVLTQFNFDGGPKTITVYNLIPGHNYSVQLFALDDRTGGDGSNPFRLVNFQDPNNAFNISSTYAMGDNAYIIGTFTASNSTVDIQQNLPTGNNGNINALVIRELGVVAPSITSQPQSVAIDQGLTASFSAVATGTAPLGYHWQISSVGGSIFTNLINGGRISGATSATLTINNLTVNDTADYRLVVTNGYLPSAISSVATLSVQPVTPLFVWSVPAAIASADATLNQSGSVVGAQVFGATPKIVVLTNGSSIDFKNDGVTATATGAGVATGAFSGNTGNADFNTVLNEFNYDNGPKTITLNNLVVGRQYSVQLFALDDRGGSATRSANFQDPADAYDYSATFFMPDNVYTLGTFTAGSSSVSLQENLFAGGGGNINALVIRQVGGPTVAPQISTQPTSKNAYATTTVQFTVGASGSALVYQWQRGVVGSGIYTNISNGGIISGATSAQLTLTGVTTNDTADYRVVVSNGAGSQNSTPAAKLTVYPLVTPTLTHRWSFNESSGTTAADSVGGANGTLQGSATFTGNGMLSLPNPTQASANSYVTIPGGLVSSLTSLTFEGWITNSGLNNGNTLIGFGGPIDINGNGTNFISFFLRWTSSQNAFQINTTNGDSGVLPLGLRVQSLYTHWSMTYDPIGGNVQLYLNGNFYGSASGVTIPLSSVGTSIGYIGYSVWNQVIGTAIPGTSGNNPFYNGYIDEVRIYSGVLNANAIAATQLLGANQVLSNVANLSVSYGAGNVTLSWPIVNGGFSLESSPTLGASAVWTAVSGTKSVVGSNYQMTVPASSATAFFRLHQ